MAIDVNEWTHKKATVRIPVNTTRRPGHRSHWTAQVGNWFADGVTEREAVNLLAESIATLAAVFEAPKIVTFEGHMAVITPVFNHYQAETPSWSVQTVYPDGHVGYSMTGGTLAEVTASARRNLAHMVADWHDDTSVHAGAAFLAGGDAVGYGQHGPTEFYRYAAWQRAAKVAIDAGRDDYHSWASDHAAEYAIPALVVA